MLLFKIATMRRLAHMMINWFGHIGALARLNRNAF